MASLPPWPSHLKLIPMILAGYARCLKIEDDIVNNHDTFQLKSPIPLLICVRVLGQLIIHTPSDSGRLYVASEIISCADMQKVVELGAHYHKHFICCCECLIHRSGDCTHQFCYLLVKAAKGATLVPSEHPSRPSFDVDKGNVQQRLLQSPQNHQAAKTAALLRDDNRCVITRQYDIGSAYSVEMGIAHGVTLTECGHIFPESLGFNLSQPKKLEYTSALGMLMAGLGWDFLDELNGTNIHRLENVMTMDISTCHLFDALEWYLEETSIPHQYKPTAFNPYLQLPELVTFSTTSNCPLPDPRYLEVHATCAKVSRYSGAGAHVGEILQELKESPFLASDGSSSEVLKFALDNAILTTESSKSSLMVSM